MLILTWTWSGSPPASPAPSRSSPDAPPPAGAPPRFAAATPAADAPNAFAAQSSAAKCRTAASGSAGSWAFPGRGHHRACPQRRASPSPASFCSAEWRRCVRRTVDTCAWRPAGGMAGRRCANTRWWRPAPFWRRRWWRRGCSGHAWFAVGIDWFFVQICDRSVLFTFCKLRELTRRE